MGYVRKRTTYRLVFEDPELAGLEVVAKAASVDTYQRIATLSSRDFGARPTAEDLIEADNLFRAFAAVLVEWNLEEEVEVKGKTKTTPVPATYEGLKSQELLFVMQIIVAWLDAAGGLFAEAPAPFDEAELPMEVLSS